MCHDNDCVQGFDAIVNITVRSRASGALTCNMRPGMQSRTDMCHIRKRNLILPRSQKKPTSKTQSWFYGINTYTHFIHFDRRCFLVDPQLKWSTLNQARGGDCGRRVRGGERKSPCIMVVVAGVRRLAGHKQTLALVQQQRRNGGSLTKNKHVEVRRVLTSGCP